MPVLMTEYSGRLDGSVRLLRNFGYGAMACLGVAAHAGALDPAVAEDAFLARVADALHVYDIDVIHNLNDRDIARGRPQRPRLGRFPDLPINTLPGSDEIDHWETEYAAAEIGGLAILLIEDFRHSDHTEFLDRWLDTAAAARLFISFHKDDSAVAEKIDSVVSGYGYSTARFLGGADLATVGNLYATAAQRLAIDSHAARRYRTDVTEIDYLGERVRRNSNSLFRDDGNRGDRRLARREPAVFLKETLGDEFSESTIREIIVPGGVALGEIAYLPVTVDSMVFDDGEMTLVDDQSGVWQLPAIAGKDLKALFDFVSRSEAIGSDAIVDIDAEGRVRISSALRDTDVGFQIMHADTLPFEYVPNLTVTKSVVIDIGVDWFTAADNSLAFAVGYEVRFLSADNMRLAQTRVALEYEYESESESASYIDVWGRDAGRLRDSLDHAGLGRSMNPIADYAGWIGLLRKLHEDEASFLHGRYEFMKLDKTGRSTPARY